MHHALQVAEILETICKHSDQNSLSQLIRTCRAFEEPSRSALWTKLDSLYPLICLLPETALEEAAAQIRIAAPRLVAPLQLTLPLSDDVWRRIKQYTSRVTNLMVHPAHMMSNPDERWIISQVYSNQAFCAGLVTHKSLEGRYLEILASLTPPVALMPMFPRSRSIRLADEQIAECIFDQSAILLRWTDKLAVTELDLRTFGLHTHHEADEAARFINSLATFFPNIRRVTFELYCCAWSSIPRSQIVVPFLSAIAGWRHLTHVAGLSSNLDISLYRHISQLESLTSLHLATSQERLELGPDLTSFLDTTTRDPHPSFPALTNIKLNGYKLHSLIRWFNSYDLSPSSLECRVLYFKEADDSKPQKLIDSITSHLDHQSLRSITLNGDSGSHPWIDDREAATTYSVRPLFVFSQLREVVISFLWVTALSDDDLEEVAFAWPHLEVLDVHLAGAAYYNDSKGMATFKGLLSFARTCTRLRELSIMLDARTHGVIDLSDDTIDRVCSRSLTKLYIMHSPIGEADVTQAADALRAIFPSLKQVDLGSWKFVLWSLKTQKKRSPPDHISLWQRVNEHLGKSFGSAQMGEY